MLRKTHRSLVYVAIFLYATFISCHALPLSTNGRWIVDAESGERVKLRCVNWPSHLEPMLAEGLHARPIKEIISEISRQGFNCVRLTWATYMFTRPHYGHAIVGKTFEDLKLVELKAGIEKNNPEFLNMTHIEAYDNVVDELGKQGIMVDVDNHVSKPTWCCGDDDGNGFFGDRYNDGQEWLRGVTLVAKHFKGKSNVVAIGMRNEPHGPYQNVNDWYKYFKEGSARVHKANPDILILISGLKYANNLTFLKQKPFGTNLDNKLVYQAHWYPWSWEDREVAWRERPINKACPNKTEFYINQTAFMNVGDDPVPIFLGEFGLDERGLSVADDRFFSCFLVYALEQDLDFGFWALHGSYYYREDKVNVDESFGFMDYRWNRVRSPKFMDRLQLMNRKNRGTTSKSNTTKIMFHPQSGLCVSASDEEVLTTNCKTFTRWNYEKDGSPIQMHGTEKCLKVVGDGLSPILSHDCQSQQSLWWRLSESKLHLAAKDECGNYMCLHKDSPNTNKISTTKCNLLEEDRKGKIYPQTDPTNQWFKFVETNV